MNQQPEIPADDFRAQNKRLRQTLEDCLLREDIACDELGDHIREALAECPPNPEVIPSAVTSGAGAKIITPEDAEQLKVENALLHGTLYLTAQALKHYRAAPHFKAGEPDMFELTVPATLPARSDDALARADAMLKNKGRER